MPPNLPVRLHVALARAGFRYDQSLARAKVLGATHTVRPGVSAALAWMRGRWPEDGRSNLLEAHDLPRIDVPPSLAPSSDDARHRDLIRLRNAAARPGGVWRLEGPILYCPNGHSLFIGAHPFGPFAEPQDIDFTRFQRRKVAAAGSESIKVRAAVFFDSPWLAYWHHFADFLAGIAWINEIGVDPSAPLVVQADRRRELVSMGLWKAAVRLAGGRKFLTVKRKQVLAVKRAYVALMPEYLMPSLKAAAGAVAGDEGGATPRRIFFVRGEALRNQRGLLGEAEIAEKFRRAGYAVVDPALMSVGAQRTLLSKATHVAGAHGSSFTNLLFAENPVRIGGFMSSAFRSTTFSALSAAAGHSFVTTVGAAGKGGLKAAFTPRPGSAERLLDWLESDAPPSEFAGGR